MPEKFIDSFLTTSTDRNLKILVAENRKDIIKLLELYKDWDSMTSIFDEEGLLDDPPGCFQC